MEGGVGGQKLQAPLNARCYFAEYHVHLGSLAAGGLCVSTATWSHRWHGGESPVCVHLISGVAALNNQPNLRAPIRIYLVTFFPVQFNQMSFYSTVYGQDEFPLRENSTWVTDFLVKLLLISFWFFFAVKPHNEMEIGMSDLPLLAASDLGFWINETSFLVRASWVT